MSTRARAWLERVAVVAFAACLVSSLTALRFEPFTFRGDGPVYYLPVISTVTSALLDGHFPRVLWQLGAGWTPFEAGQIGLGYPPYLLVGLVCRALGRPLAFLTMSAFVHLALAGLAVRELAPPTVPARNRVLGTFVAMVQPAPILLGMPWHVVLSAYPWVLALSLLLWLSDLGDRRVKLAIPLVSTLLFWVGHPHTFLWTWLLVGTAAVVLRRPSLRGLLATWRPFACAGLAVVVPLFWLWHAAKSANVAFIRERWEPGFLLLHAQSLADVVPGLLVGNLSGWVKLDVWGHDLAGGAGVFFCPLVVVALVDAIRTRRFGVILFLLLFVILVAPRDFDVVSLIAHGPLAGTRWTWRFTAVLLPPVAVAMTLGARPGGTTSAEFEPSRRRDVAAAVAALASLAVVWRGASFDLATVWWDHREAGIEGLVRETARFARTLHQPARVALVGRHRLLSSGAAVPLAYAGLVGNAPLLVPGLETAHIHEPLESEDAAREHWRLTTPWRSAVPSELFVEEPQRARRSLEAVGVTAVVALDPKLLPADGDTKEFVSDRSRKLWVRELAPSPPYPLRGPGERLADGALRVPHLGSLRPTRPLVLSLEGGWFVARPPLPWAYLLLGVVGAGGAVLLALWPFRRPAAG